MPQHTASAAPFRPAPSASSQPTAGPAQQHYPVPGASLPGPEDHRLATAAASRPSGTSDKQSAAELWQKIKELHPHHEKLRQDIKDKAALVLSQDIQHPVALEVFANEPENWTRQENIDCLKERLDRLQSRAAIPGAQPQAAHGQRR